MSSKEKALELIERRKREEAEERAMHAAIARHAPDPATVPGTPEFTNRNIEVVLAFAQKEEVRNLGRLTLLQMGSGSLFIENGTATLWTAVDTSGHVNNGGVVVTSTPLSKRRKRS